MYKRRFIKKLQRIGISFFVLLGLIFTSIIPSPLLLFVPAPALAQGESCSQSDLQAYLSARVGGVALDQAATFLADMTDITGAYYDSVNDRIVFVGKEETGAPKFDKDDLAVAIKAVVFNNSLPAVSIEFKDPYPHQDPNKLVLYYGGIEDTKFGKVLLDADYKMKIYSHGYDEQGQIVTSSVPGYKSFLTRYVEKPPDPNYTGVNHSRFWISPLEIVVKKDDNSQSFVIDHVKMQVETQGINPDNEPAWNQAATEFSQHQTEYYDQFAAESLPYYDAKQLAKIVAIVKWLRDNNIATDFNWAQNYQPKYVYTPREVPRLTTPYEYDSNGIGHSITGGVDYYTPNTYNPDDGSASSLKNASEAVNAPKEQIKWEFSQDGQQFEAVAVSADAFRSLGAYSTHTTDLTTPIAGDMQLEFARGYSSFSGGQKGIGRGWDFMPARLSDNKSGWTLTCDSGTYQGTHIWKLAFQMLDGTYETFTFYNCTVGYTADDPAYHSKAFHNSDGTYLVRLKNQTEYIFDATLKLTKVRDPQGNELLYGYNGSNQLNSISDQAGHQLTLSYNGQSLVTQVSDWAGRAVQYGYDTQSNLTQVTDARGQSVQYTYDANNKLASIKNRLGQTVLQMTYTPEAKIATQTSASNQMMTYAYDTDTKTISYADNNGRTGSSTYDDKARVLVQTDAANKQLSHTYGVEYAPLSVIDKRGNTTSFLYDAQGNTTRVTFPDTKQINYTYNVKNDITNISDGRYGATAKQTSFTYDTQGNVTQKNEAGRITSFTYNAQGDILTTTDPLSHLTTLTRNNFGDPLTLTNHLNKTTIYQYDAAGRLTQMVDPLSKSISYTYDANNNIVSKTDAGGATSYVYDGENRLTQTTLPDNTVTKYSYNSSNSLTQVEDALLHLTSYGFDQYQNVVSQTDALSHATNFVYDQLDRKTQETTPLNKTTQWTYDANGNIASRIDALNRTTTYTYDAFNRLTQISYPDTTTTTFTYDNRGNLTQMVSPVGTTAYTYDTFDRLTAVTNPYGRVLSYLYNAADSLTRITYPDNKQVNYAYDAHDRLITVTDWNNQQVTYTYHDNDMLQSKTLPNGVAANYTYDGANRLASLAYIQSQSTLAQFDYQRDSLGHITQVTETGSAFGQINPSPSASPAVSPSPSPSIIPSPSPSIIPTPTPTSIPSSTPTPIPTPSASPVPSSSPLPSPSGGGADLIVTSITLSIPNPQVDQNFDVIVKVKNQGTQATTASTIKVGYYYDFANPPPTTTSLYDDSETYFGTIAPNQEITTIETLTDFQTSGNHTIWALADRANAQVESNEANNALGITVYVSPEARGWHIMYAKLPFIKMMQNWMGSLVKPAYAQTPPPLITNFTYDVLGRLTQTAYPDTQTYGYTYDATGNRLTQSLNASPKTYSYNNDNQLTQVDQTAYVYDNAGNLTTKTGNGSATFTYNFDSRLTQSVVSTPPTSQESNYTLNTTSLGGIDIGSYSTPQFVDIDADGDLDLFVGKSTGTLSYYQNTGSASSPTYSLISSSFSSIDVGDYSSPVFADLDADGDKDLLVGESVGNINQYQNTGSTTSPVYTLVTATLGGIDIGSYSRPTLSDMDGDLDSDLIIGESGGVLKYYTNIGTPQSPNFQLGTLFSGIDIGSHSAPAFVDRENDGDLDLFIGKSDGTVAFYRNTGTAAVPAFTLEASTFGSIDIGSYSIPAFADINSDGDRDLFIGESTGNVNYYEAIPQGSTQITTTFTYDGLGNRLQKVVGSTTVRYVNDLSGSLSRVVAETNASNTIQAYYVYGVGYVSEGGATSSTREYPLTDGQGNVRFLTSSTGTVIKSFNYDPFGNIRATSGTGVTPYQFSTEAYDAEAGLYYLRARYYDPTVGRFMTRDPIKGLVTNPQTLNAYPYVLNDPVNLHDPSGLWALGGCISANYGLAAFGTCSACIVYTSDKEFGFTLSAGGGGSTGLATGIGPQILYSTGNNFKDLGAVDIFGGGSFEVWGVDAAFSADDPNIKTYTTGPSFGPDYTPPMLPGEFHGGATNTWTYPLIQF